MMLKGLRKSQSGPSGSTSTSTTYDYSHIDEKRQAYAKANSMEGDAAQAAYSGDIGSTINASNKIRSLRKQADSISNAPRVRSVSTSRSSNIGSASGGVDYAPSDDGKKKMPIPKGGTKKPAPNPAPQPAPKPAPKGAGSLIADPTAPTVDKPFLQPNQNFGKVV